jgi:hypothetical protein
VRGSGSEPTTTASAALGLRAFMKAVVFVVVVVGMGAYRE